MLWVKAFHIIFVASWFAGLFYLPRIFVNLALVPAESKAERERLLLMGRKLMRFTTILMIPAVILGLTLWLYYGIGVGTTWMYLKLFFIALALGYHHACGSLLRKFERGENHKPHTWYRIFNESAVIVFAATVILVVVKPF